MSVQLHVFRVLADVSHTSSKLILIWAIHSNRSAEGVSLLTQLLYIAVFVSRYLDLFWVPPAYNYWNFVLKIFYMVSSAYIVYLMMRVFARTREKEYGWKLATWSLAGSLVSAPLVCVLFEGVTDTTFSEVLWTFSIILESICVLPQLLLLRQTSVPTVIDSFYLVTLGIYRFLYILHWFARGFAKDALEPSYWTSVVFGIVQTALYVDFAWVYWSRQRVKLRGGGIVDSDDLKQGFLVRRLIGRQGNRNSSEDDDDIADEDAGLAGQESGTIRPQAPRSARSWGRRGISVSADDTLADHRTADARMADPSQFEDDVDDDTDAPPPPPPSKDFPREPGEPQINTSAVIESSATEWRGNDGNVSK